MQTRHEAADPDSQPISTVVRLDASHWRLFLALLVAGIVASGAATAAPPGETPPERPAPTRVDVVGNATIKWHLAQAKPSARTNALIERYQEVTAAHVAGVELPPAAAPAPVAQRSGVPVHGLPAELIPTLFVHPDGGTYCSTSAAPAPHAAARDR